MTDAAFFEMTLPYMTTEELHEIAEDYQLIVDGKINTAGTILPNAVDAEIAIQVIKEIVAERAGLL